MHLFDPNRPKLPNGNSTYVDPTGRPIAAMPPISVQLQPNGKANLTLWLLRGQEAFAYHYLCKLCDIKDFFYQWQSDPEYTMEQYFSYTFTAVSAKAVPTLTDLGL